MKRHGPDLGERITHSMLFLCVSKYALNSFFSHGINFLAALCFAQLLSQLKMFLPYMCCQDSLAIFISATNLPAGTGPAYFCGTAVGVSTIFTVSSVPGLLLFRACKVVSFWDIGEIPETIFISFIY